MKKYDYIYLKDNKNAYFLKYLKNANIQNYYICNPKNKLFRILLKFKFNRQLIWGNWKKNIHLYNFVIMGENSFDKRFTKYIKKVKPNCRIIMFYWNCLSNNYKRFLNDPNIDEFWTFDKKDAQKYNLNYNSQFYTKNIILPKRKIIYDIIFIGRDKGRFEKLEELKLIFNKLNINFKFIIVTREKDLISYDNYLELLAKSSVILDICSGEQIGLSLRVMESIFFEKKLVTNNLDVLNCNFYNPNNIFIIGKDDYKNLNEFLKSPYKKMDQKIIDYYDFHTWIKRFKNKSNP